MMFKLFKRTVSAAAAAVCFAAAVPTVPLSASAESHKLISYEGYDYEYWSDSDDNTVSFDIDNKGGFVSSWNAYGSCFASKGLIEQKPASNHYKIDYDLSINFGPVQNATADNACTYICAYGFLQEPMAEFFFTDYDSVISRYENNEYFTPLGSFETDGKTYDLYSQKINMHTIDSAVSYTRYLSIRRGGEMKDRYELGQSWGGDTEYSDYSGQIDVGAHFDALEKLGEKIGVLDRLSLNVESYRSSGEVKLNSCDLTEYQPAADPTPSEEKPTGDVNGDEVFSISDVVMLQQWLIGSLDPWMIHLEAADLNNDGRIDIFDLCEMRRAVIGKMTAPAAVTINVGGGWAGVKNEWKAYEENGSYILSFQNLKLDKEPVIYEITEEEYREIMAQDYEMNVAPPNVRDGYYYNSVITYKDGTKKDSKADMSEVTWVMEKILSLYNNSADK